MKKITPFILILFFAAQNVTAQSAIAQIKYEEAEEAYSKADYTTTLLKLSEAEALLGKTHPRILYLRIVSQNKLIEQNPYNDYSLLSSLRENCNKYLKEHGNIEDTDDRYREVYKISESLTKYPDSSDDFVRKKNEIEQEKRQAEQEKRQAEEAKAEAIRRKQEETKREEEERQKTAKLAEEEYQRGKKARNKFEFMNVGIQSGSIGKYGIVYEDGSEKRFGLRMSVRGSFIFGENVAEHDKTYIPQNDTKQGRFALDLGPTFRLSKWFYLYAGVGFGTYSNWTLNKVYSESGTYEGEEYCAFDEDGVIYFETSIGAMLRLGRIISLNGGYSFINLSSPEFTFGLSFNLFKKEE